MVMAKRQRKRKTCENGTKEDMWTGVRTSGETNTPLSWLAQFAQGRLIGEETKNIKKGSQDGLRLLLWGQPALTPQECIILCLPNKTEL